MKCSLLSVLTLVGVLSGCDQAAEDRAAKQAAESVREGNQALRQLSEKVKQGSSEVARAAESGASKVGEHVSDAAITAKVKAALLADPSVDGLKIDVDTKDAVVTLRGALPEAAQSARAEDIAGRVQGVRSVQNDLKHDQPAPLPPAS
jgi:hyperosmotically inducible protein